MVKKLNAYFKLMLAAKKKKSPSFNYKGSTYLRTKSTKGNIYVYKKKGGKTSKRKSKSKRRSRRK